MAISKIGNKALGAGAVLQVVQSVKTSYQSINSTSYVDVTDLSVVITPTSASSKILVCVNTFVGSSNATEVYAAFKCLRNATAIGVSTAGSGSNRQASFGISNNTPSGYNPYSLTPTSWQYLDSPNTESAITYKIQACGSTGYTQIDINKISSGGTADYVTSTTSTITVMEIAA